MNRVLVVGHLTLDAICSQVARTAHFDIPQGAALGSALAAATTGASVWLATKVGRDYPEKVLEILEGGGIKTTYLERNQAETLRFWILRENDRYCIDHPFASTPIENYTPSAELFPLSVIDKLDAAHICPMPILDQLKWVERLRPHIRLISVDPQPFRYAGPHINLHERFSELLRQVDILSISLEDFPDLAESGIADALRMLLRAGPAVVTIKMGASGSAVAVKSNDEWARFRAAGTALVDETGAGDAYAGAFLSCYAATGDALTSAKRASATAHVMISEVGMLHINGAAESISQVENRYDATIGSSRVTLSEPLK